MSRKCYLRGSIVEKEHKFIWSDNWYIEDKKAWFIDGQKDILFYLDLESNECEYIASIPEPNPNKFRLTPRCMKIGNEIFCMPDNGDNIWVYNIEDSNFYKINIKNLSKDSISITDFWQYDNKLFMLATGLKKIIEIDIGKKVITNYYEVCDKTEDKIAKHVRLASDIYCISASSNKIYQFNFKSRNIIVHEIPDGKGNFFAIAYDGQKFWLSNYSREIYVWNKESNSVKILKDFPEQFGNYTIEGNGENFLDCTTDVYETPAFIEIMALGQYIWFIPFRTNKIIYVDKDSYEIFSFDIENEIETENTLNFRPLSHKYLLEYVRNNRYLGLFSLKNNYIIEIDTLEMRSEIKKYEFSDRCILEISRMYGGYILCENNGLDRRVFESILLGSDVEEKNKKTDNTGLNIYEAIK